VQAVRFDAAPAELKALPPIVSDVEQALAAAVAIAEQRSAQFIGSDDLLYGALSVTANAVARQLQEQGLRMEEEEILAGDGLSGDLSAAGSNAPVAPVPPPFGGEMRLPGYESSLPANPTPKVASDLWAEKDCLGYEAYARTIASLITHTETKPPLTIGIKAPWGAGKTTLMKRVQHLLDGRAELSEQNRSGARQQGQSPRMTLWKLRQELKQITKSENGTLKSPEPQKVPAPSNPEGAVYGLPPRITVWFNAWKYQTSEQVWAGMAHCIISQVTARMSIRDRELFWLRLHARRINTDEVRRKALEILLRAFVPVALLIVVACAVAIWVAGAIQMLPLRYVIQGASALAGLFGVIWKARDSLGEKAAGTMKELIREPDYEGKMGYLHLVESDIREVFNLVTAQAAAKAADDSEADDAALKRRSSTEDPLVVFVDDLDRCAPNKVAEVVEAINLFLCGDYPNCIFVLGMEPGMVAAALEVANKDVIDKAHAIGVSDETVPVGWRFMEKIVQLPIMIPPPTKGGRDSYLRSLTGADEAQAETDRVMAKMPASPPAAPTGINMAGILPQLQENTFAKIAQDRLKAQELERAPLNEDVVQKFAAQMKGRTLAEVQENGEKILADAKPEERRAAAEATKRAYALAFSERDPVIVELMQEVVRLVDGNPRQIKRYVNVLRFYSTLRYSLIVDQVLGKDEVSDKLLAKFVTLSIHWPHAVDCLRVRRDAMNSGGNGAAKTLLQMLEAESRRKLNDGEIADDTWKKYVGKKGLKLQPWVASRAFREFLAAGESLCEKEGHGLW